MNTSLQEKWMRVSANCDRLQLNGHLTWPVFFVIDGDDDLLVANMNHSVGFGEFSEEETDSSEEEEDSEEDEEEEEDDEGSHEEEEHTDEDDEQVRETARRLGNTIV